MEPVSMIRTAETVWSSCLEFIKDNVKPQAYKTWFMPIVPVKLSDSFLTIQVPSEFFYEWLEEHYISLLSVALKRELGPEGKLRYDIKLQNNYSSNMVQSKNVPSSNRPPLKPQSVTVKTTQASREVKNPFVIPGLQKVKVESNLNPTYNFDNFMEGDSNRLGRSAGMAVANKPGGTSFNPLMIYGGVGLGKTHLAHAIGVQVKEKYPDKTVLYVSTEKFIQQYTDAVVKNNNKNDFLHFYQMIDVLIVDDIQFLSGKSKTQDAFFQIFNELHQNGKQVILTSDKAPVDMQDIENRLLSRFKWGLSAELQAPDYETRVAILKNRLYRDGVEVPEEIVEYIAKNIKSNVRELEGVVISLIAQASFNKREYSIDLARTIVDKFVKNTKKEVSVEYIQKVVSKYFEIDLATLQSKTRKRHIVQARQLAMYFSKKLTKSSLASIGAQIGKRDHATVLHACKTVDNLYSTDKQFKKYVEDLTKKLSF